MPVRTYSSGMYMRLGFSVAMHIQPDVLLLDEVLAVGDEAFQQKCFGRIARLQARRRDDRLRLARPERGRAASATGRCCSSTGASVERGPCRRTSCAPTTAGSSARRGGCGRAARRRRAGGAVRVHEVRAVAGDGIVRDRFTEGEPMALEVWLYAEDGVEDARVTVGFRDADEPAARLADGRGRASAPGAARAAAAPLPGLPMREGRFFVDVGLDERGRRRRARRAPSARSS